MDLANEHIGQRPAGRQRGGLGVPEAEDHLCPPPLRASGHQLPQRWDLQRLAKRGRGEAAYGRGEQHTLQRLTRRQPMVGTVSTATVIVTDEPSAKTVPAAGV
jgi:hypothetical protein